MFRSFSRPAWANPEQSVGPKCERKIGNLNCYEATGRVSEVFDEIAPLIRDLLDTYREDLEKGEQRPRAIAFGIFMIGSEPSQTQPTVVFASLSLLQRRRAKSLVVEKKLLADRPNIRMKALSQLPALPRSDSCATSSRHHDDAGSGEQPLQVTEDSVRRPTLLTLDGGGVRGLSQLLILGSLMERIADLDRSISSARSSSVLSSIDHAGGFVQVGRKTFSVAPLHPYLDLGPNEEEDAELSEDLEFDPDSDDEFESEHSLLLAIRSCQSEDDQTMALNAVPDHIRAAVSPKRGLDYRITEVYNEERLYNVINVDSNHSRQITPQNVASKPEERDVIVNTRTTGPVHGRLMRSPRYIKMAGWSDFQEMWVVKMDRDAIPGDCGAWVVEDDDESTETKLYGHVVAGQPGSLEAYILPACVMFDDIEARLGARPRLPTLESFPRVQPHDFFDLVAGTSTGGLIAIMLGQLRMSIDECIDAYRTLGEEVFRKPRLASIRGPIPWLRPKFSHMKLEGVLHGIVQRHSGLASPLGPAPGNQPFRSPPGFCQTLVVARGKDLDTGNPQAFLFRTYSNRITAHFRESVSPVGTLFDTVSDTSFASNGSLSDRSEKDVRCTPLSSIGSRNSHETPLIWKVARATSAAPTFFKSIKFQGHSYVDGAVYANNPARLAVEEVQQSFGSPSLLVSIGTGRSHKTVRHSTKSLYGKLRFFLDPSKKLSADSEEIHGELQDLFANDPEASYYRFNVDTSLADVKLDEWKRGSSSNPGTFDTILQHTKAYLSREDVRNEIEKAAKSLIECRQLRLALDRSCSFTAHGERSRCGVESKVLGPEHPSTLKSMNKLALLYQSQGKFEAAESIYKETLQLREKILGLEHPETLMSMNSLALLYQSQGKFEAAESVYKETLQLRKKVLGPEHPETITSMNNLALLYQRQGKSEAAGPIYEETPQLSKKALSIASTASGNEPNPYQRIVELSHYNGSTWCDSVQIAILDTGCGPNVISQQGLDKIGHVQRYPIPPNQLNSYKSPLVGSSNTITPIHFIYVKLHSSRIGLHDDRVKLMIMEEAEGFDIILGRSFIIKNNKNNTGSLLARVEQTSHDNIESEIMSSQVQSICALREVEATKEPNEKNAAHRKKMETWRTRMQITSPLRAGSVVSGDAVDARRHWRTTVPQLPHAYYEDKTPIQLQADQSQNCPAEWQSVKTSTSSSISSESSRRRQSTVSSASSWGIGVEMFVSSEARSSVEG